MNFRRNRNERGVALVITLIMLSVITFLTVAFLAVSRRDRAAVTTSLNQTDSHLMANTALDRFQSELVSGMMARNDLYNYDLMMTRNFINPNGFNPALGRDTNNVNYDFKVGGNPLANDDRIINIANLYFDPRPPVFVKTNSNPAMPLDFRFYLDYNRNGRFETNGLVDIFIDEIGTTTNKAEVVGEPEWIGVLQNPELPHGPNNRFIGRYLYLALPIGKTLDWNHIHNYAKAAVNGSHSTVGNNDGFIRNQGIGSWELNLAGFLVDLNTNMYVQNLVVGPYSYYPDPLVRNTGDPFNDALSFLNYRYATTLDNLSSVQTLYPGNGGTAFSGVVAFNTDFIDGYSTRPITNSPFINIVDPDASQNLTGQPWSGSDNTNRLMNPQELFNTNKSSANFVTQLQRVSTNNNSYDRYTFSRLLQMIGMSSEPEVKGKININYVNDPKVNSVNTNFVQWTPIQFFTNTVDRLFKDNLTFKVVGGVTNWYMFNTTNNANLVHAGFSYTNIQIWPTNEYTPQLHRLLQVAANIYDATSTNKFPTVFRPQFSGSSSETYITNFVMETNATFVGLLSSNVFQERTNVTNPNGFVWGVPLVLGAKKGFPAFDKYIAQTAAQVSRNLQIRKASSAPNAKLSETNQMWVLGVSNTFGLSLWNSYRTVYTNSVRILVTNSVTLAITNEAGTIIWPSNGKPFVFSTQTNFTTNLWAPAPFVNSYILPLGTNYLNFLTNSQYTVAGVFRTNKVYERNSGFPIPHWGFVMSNRLASVIIDVADPGNQRVIDFVNFDNMNRSLDITKELLGNDYNSAPGVASGSPVEGVWKTNRVNGGTSIADPTLGIINQIDISLGNTQVSENEWTSYNLGNSSPKDEAIAKFRKYMGLTPFPPYQKMDQLINSPQQTPFNPTRKLDQIATWEVNDPLVHYTVRDLLGTTNALVNIPRIPPSGPPPNMSLAKLSTRYQPWGGNHPPGQNGQEQGTDSDPDAYNWMLKDPGVGQSDDWDFPTNKFPSIGWLGRVHRGTPWQTIYLKAGLVGDTNWFKWAGHNESYPTNDWHLMDVFTTSPNDNAASGLLSVNQTNQAAWSAVLSGVVALSNSVLDAQLNNPNSRQFQSYVIQPNSPQVHSIVTNLFALRQAQPNQVFHSIGDILAASELTMGSNTNGTFGSQFLNLSSKKQIDYGLTDDVVERIPQQIMSLLKLGEPRYVIYCYGQSLKPANNSLVLSPPSGSGLFNLCTNYQITGEVLTRTVLRVEPNPDAQHPKTVIESYNVLSSDE